MVRSALLHAGHAVSRSHACPGSLKTTAPRAAVHDILRSWIKLHPVNMAKLAEGAPARRLLAKEPAYVLPSFLRLTHDVLTYNGQDGGELCQASADGDSGSAGQARALSAEPDGKLGAGIEAAKKKAGGGRRVTFTPASET